MSEPVRVERIDLGVIDGQQTWKVINADTGETIGYDQSTLEVA